MRRWPRWSRILRSLRLEWKCRPVHPRRSRRGLIPRAAFFLWIHVHTVVLRLRDRSRIGQLYISDIFHELNDLFQLVGSCLRDGNVSLVGRSMVLQTFLQLCYLPITSALWTCSIEARNLLVELCSAFPLGSNLTSYHIAFQHPFSIS